jgi:crotonobetainyl-CoA:carnitine CoA-transferase CaiB-like acyl-CoA transferase
MENPVLEGFIVVDLTRNLAGPFCSMILGDLGAEVIKVEQPGAGDDTRAWGPPSWGPVSAAFASANRNKRGVAIDLNRPEGAEIVRSLARRADVLVESFKPGSLDRRGLGWDDLAALNDRLVYCSISAYGQRGPMRDGPGYDPVIQAYTGIMHITGHPEGEAARLGVGALDLGAAMWGVIGIQAALGQRAVTGRGTRVDTSLLETATWWLSYHLLGYLASGIDPQRQGTTTGFIAPYETFPTAEGDIFVAAPNDNLFRAFALALDLPELVDDPRFVDNPTRVRNRVALRDRIVVRVATRPAGEWEAVLRAASVPCTVVRSVGDFASDAQLAALELVRPLPHADAPELAAIDLPVQVDGGRSARWEPPPRLGEHTDAVLTELGYDAARIAALREAGTVA